MKKNTVLVITRTAVMIAILVMIQFVTKSLGQYVTGSLVNLVLAVAALTVGVWEGVIIAAVSPFFAFMFGIGPAFIQIVPFVAVGNIVLVVVLWVFAGRENTFDKKGIVRCYAGAVVAAVAKFITLWAGVTKISFLLIPAMKPAQIEKMTAMFTWPQLFTALIGTAVAIIIVPQIKKAISKQKT
mgnify:FL=1